MVNITCAAYAAISVYASLAKMISDDSIPISDLATQLSYLYLPNYTTFTLGKISISPDRASVEQGWIASLTAIKALKINSITLKDSRVEPMSDKSAMCWLSWWVDQPNVERWSWSNPRGFRLVEGGTEDGLDGGWEWSNGDDEAEQFSKRFGL